LEQLHVIILGIIQGIAEFLPISSSGHIVIADAILAELPGDGKLPDTNDLNIALHAGTLLSILVVYWRRIVRLLGADRRVIPMIVVATLPVVVSGLILSKYFRHWLDNPLLAGCMLPITGLLLLWAARRPVGDDDYTQLTYGKALAIGLFQAVAPLPGISRSGTTIAAGLAVGLSRQAAATFSFLLAIPAIGGAILLEIWKLISDKPSDSLTPGTTAPLLSSSGTLLALGAAVSFLVGLLALCWLIRWLEKGRIQYFAYWCIPVGFAVIVWQLVRAG
jgi:undecaprenyl-diphosphatase